MNPEQKRHEGPEFAKQPGKTYIMQLVEKNPEMPEEIELNRERRKQLAELMLEYPMKIEEEEENRTHQPGEEKKILYMYEL